MTNRLDGGVSMRIALIAHDQKKKEMLQFVIAYEEILMDHQLYATGTTGKIIKEQTKLKVHCFKSGPIGGDQQIGAMIANEEMDIIFFFRDPLTAQPHEPDVSALMRLCDVHYIPLATNLAAAEIFIHGLVRGDLKWRELIGQNREELNK